MKNKLISAVVTLSMLLVMLSSLTVTATGSGKLTVTADKDFVKKGENVTYTVSVNGLSSVRGVQIGLTYDADKASYVSDSINFIAQNFTDYSGYTYDDNKIGIAFAMEEETDYTGTIASFMMNAEESGKIGMAVDNLVIKDTDGNTIDLDVDIKDAEVVNRYNVEFLAVPDKDTINIGDEITYTVSMSELTLKGMQFSAEYDDTYLELIDAEVNSQYTMVKSIGDSRVDFVMYNRDRVDVSGDVASLKFKAKYVDKSISNFSPVRITGFKAADSDGPIDSSYVSTCQSISLQKSDQIEISFNADTLIAGEGDLVSYTVMLNGIEDYRGIQTALKYDSSKLEFVSAEKLSLMELAETALFSTVTTGTVGIVCVFPDVVSTTGGELARINFKVKEGASGFADMYESGTKVSADGQNYLDADYYSNIDEVYTYSGQKVVLSAQPSETLVIPGETFEYTFEMSDVVNFAGMQIELRYDSSMLECIGITNGSVLNDAVIKVIKKTSDGIISGMINYKDGYTGSGDVFTVKFVAKQVSSLSQPEVYFSSFVSNDYITYDISPTNLYPTDPAEEAINAIDAIGNVTLADKAAITYARNLYDSLSSEVQDRVTNYSALVNAEREYSRLYAPVDRTIRAINRIGNVTLESKADIDAANAQYEALSYEAKTYVTNYNILVSANEEYNRLYDALPVYECVVSDGVVTLTQNKPCSEQLKLYIAQYNSDNTLACVNIHDVSGSNVYTYNQSGDTVRVFVWNDSMEKYTNIVYR